MRLRPATSLAPQRYVMLAPIGAGGMATIHLGRMLGAEGFSRPVAIKRLHPHLAGSTDLVTMLLDEGRLAARIAHPNVVATLDVVRTDDDLFLVMEYVDGVPLSLLLERARRAETPVPLDVVAAIAVGMLHGLHAAHEARNDAGERIDLVHRDVSPQNVLLAADGIPRVADFGIAKAAGRSHVTEDGQLKGKIPYMAPEQLRAGEVDRRADVWAAAIVIWEMIAGRRAYQGDDGQAMGEILFGKLPPPSTVATDRADTLDAVVMRGLERFPERRWETARAMADAIEAELRPATPSAVGGWVKRLAEADLDARAKTFGELNAREPERIIETGKAEPAAATIVATPQARSAQRWRGVSIALGVAVLVLAGVVVIPALRRPADVDRPPAAPAGEPATSASAAMVETAAPETSVTPPVTSSQSVATASGTAIRRRPGPASQPLRAAPPPKAGAAGARDARCYRLDDQGIWHIKPECL